MTKSKKVLDFLFSWVAGLSGLMGAIFCFANGIFGFFDFHIDKPFVILIGLLGVLLMSSGYERWSQRKEIEARIRKLSLDFETLKTEFLQIPFYDVIEDDEKITADSTKELKNVESIIRVTSFKIGENEDTRKEFYDELGRQIKLKSNKLIYKCCFNKGNNLDRRKEAFQELKLTEKEYKRMEYYEFKDQYYFNFLIIDDNVVYIGFPRHQADEHMQIALKIKAENNKVAQSFIKSLITWYDNFLLPKGKLVPDTKKFLDY
jgi:hypothetical protein